MYQYPNIFAESVCSDLGGKFALYLGTYANSRILDLLIDNSTRFSFDGNS